MKTNLLAAILLFTISFASAVEPSAFELRAVADTATDRTKEYSLPPRKGRSETILLDSTILLDRTALKSATLEREPDGTPRILIILTESGGKLFGDITTQYAGKRLGIILDGKLLSAPVIGQPIFGGSLNIGGNLSDAEATDLVKKLNESINR